MNIFVYLIGLAIALWVGAMGLGAFLGTKSAQTWFGERLEQGPKLMRINGFGLLVGAIFIVLGTIWPQMLPGYAINLALIGILIAQISSLFMLIRGHAPKSAMAGPIVLMILIIIYWFLRP